MGETVAKSLFIAKVAYETSNAINNEFAAFVVLVALVGIPPYLDPHSLSNDF
jgi:hypothetical protein